MIDTKQKRDVVNEMRGEHGAEARVMVHDLCDELDRLYRDTTPLTREELETVPREAVVLVVIDDGAILKFKRELGVIK